MTSSILTSPAVCVFISLTKLLKSLHVGSYRDFPTKSSSEVEPGVCEIKKINILAYNINLINDVMKSLILIKTHIKYYIFCEKFYINTHLALYL